MSRDNASSGFLDFKYTDTALQCCLAISVEIIQSSERRLKSYHERKILVSSLISSAIVPQPRGWNEADFNLNMISIQSVPGHKSPSSPSSPLTSSVSGE